MKALKLSLVILAAVSITIGLSGTAYAFHSGGVADCDGCHTMHNSLGGKPMGKGSKTLTEFVGTNWLLIGSDQSSTCLNCHATSTPTSNYHIMTYPITSGSTIPSQYTPGGDFGWLLEGFTPTSGAHYPASPGYEHGHNINALDFGLPSGPPLTSTAPGGTYLQSNLHCSSCHNPHPSARIVSNPVTTSSIVNSAIGTTVPPISASGSYAGAWPPTAGTALGVYRLLAGIGYVPFSYTGGPAFINPPPVATAPTTWNQVETTNDVRVAYGTVGGVYGMAEWCQNCHPQIYNVQATGTTTPHLHPTGVNAVLSATANISGTSTSILAIYNAYVYSGNLSGSQTTSYTSLVPYEEAQNDLTQLSLHTSNVGGYLAGPTLGTEHVHCLSCHRAHASGFNQATRWNMNSEFETVAGLWPDSANPSSAGYSNGMPQALYTAAMYQRLSTNYASYQRVFCNKCHGKD